MKIPSTLIKAMLLSATLSISAGCKTRKANPDTDTRDTKHERHHNPHDCPGCGMG